MRILIGNISPVTLEKIPRFLTGLFLMFLIIKSVHYYGTFSDVTGLPFIC